MIAAEVEGARELARTLARATDKLGHLDAGPAAELVRRGMSSRAPRRSGALSRSPTVVRADGAAVTVESRLPYAGVIEVGWPGHNIAAQPYARPALEAATPGAVEDFTRQADRVLAAVRGA